MDQTQDQPQFTPATRRHRHDGWTPERQRAFIEALASCGCVAEAARAVGVSENSAYRLRRSPDADSFRMAWTMALDCGLQRLADHARSRALHGVARPIFHNGEQVGEWRHFDERLTMFLLRAGDPSRFGQWLGRSATERDRDVAARLLPMLLDQIERSADLGADDDDPHFGEEVLDHHPLDPGE